MVYSYLRGRIVCMGSIPVKTTLPVLLLVICTRALLRGVGALSVMTLVGLLNIVAQLLALKPRHSIDIHTASKRGAKERGVERLVIGNGLDMLRELISERMECTTNMGANTDLYS